MKAKKIQLKEIQNILVSISEKLLRKSGRNSVWTDAIKGEMLTLGHGLGWQVFMNGKYRQKSDWKGEWMFDVSYVAQKESFEFDYPFLGSLGLALECEWATATDPVIDDFQKLLLVKASAKVMIWQGHSQLLDYMKRNIRLWDDPPRTYLLADWVNRENAFAFEVV